jgi:hypothetical protein
MSAARGDDLERRTVAWLEQCGYRAERVSRRGRFGGGDLFGCVDVLAVNAEGVELIQVTTKTNASARRRKIREAGLPFPVHLFLWFKHKNRWTFVGETVRMNAEGADADHADPLLNTAAGEEPRNVVE